ncbi:MAG: hypothetical protein KatS3mg105_2978 [Gemmatales bacterium]|nr:MAG: hypothetical protein KatS3mg105_2978 [Gemmatales bacterium]
MRNGILTSCCLLALIAPTIAQAQGEVVFESWDAAYLGGTKAGYVHTITHAIKRGEETFYRTSTELHLTLQRFKQTITLRMENGTEETPDGKVTSVFMHQVLGKQQERLLTGTVQGNMLAVVVDEIRNKMKRRVLERKIPWDENVLGLYKQQLLLKEKRIKPGDQLSFRSYEPTINAVINTKVHVKDYETVEVRGKKMKLLRVESIPDRIEAQNASIQLPPLTTWHDKDYVALRSQVEVPGLGQLTLYRTNRDFAVKQTGPVAKLPDIGLGQLVRLKRRIPRAYDTRVVVYRIRIKDDKDPVTAFANDDRQTVKKLGDDLIEVRVDVPADEPVENPAPVEERYLKSCYFINCDDSRVKELAKLAVGKETDPWQKALRIERWVHRNMKNKNFSEAFATADHVARTLEGDCTEHAMLAAAMCRAVGVPSRTALGLVYIENIQGPAMGFHMWTEVYVRGRWRPIDATLGRGFVGGSHLKITHHSWHDAQSLTPLLPVVRVVGKISIEVAEARLKN